MLRRFLDFQYSILEKKSSLRRFRPLVSAVDSFCFEPAINTKRSPFIRDAIDVKRWMILVVIALLPAIFMAIWNTGIHKMVYSSSSYPLMKEYLHASTTFRGYFDFVFKDQRYLTILSLGTQAFLPLVLISYAVGGLCEGIIACIRQTEIAEGFLVTGILYPLILPPIIPYWMVALGVAFGVIIGKELFGGTGMNIFNPALVCRAFLFFTFPGKMTSANIWVGLNTDELAASMGAMNTAAHLNEIDGFSSATPLGTLHLTVPEIKRIHVDTIATNMVGDKVSTYPTITAHFEQWKELGNYDASLGHLSIDQLQNFITSSPERGGLDLAVSNFPTAYQFVDTSYGLGKFSDGNLFWGNIPGSLGETSTFACLLGAIFLIYMGIGSWRIMVAMGLSAFITAFLFQFLSTHIGVDSGAWNPAKFAIPAYKHLLFGGLAFGLVFMATDPVSAPGLNSSKWIYGSLIGFLTIIIRMINPAYSEGVMLAILLGNVFAPLIDYIMIRKFRSSRLAAAARKYA